MKKNMDLSRRSFIKQSALTVAALPFLGTIGAFLQAAPAAAAKGKKKETAPPAGQKPVDLSDPVASAVGYKHDVKDIDYAKYPQRKKPDAKNQFCKNCTFYTKSNEGWGKCQIIPNGLVNADGWCASWNKKA